MALHDDLVKQKRKKMTLFYVVDTSGSMQIDSRIGKVNSAIENVMNKLEEISDSNEDAEIRVAILEFSTGAHWVTPVPVSPSEYMHVPLQAGGVTDLGAACKALDDKLHRDNGFLDVSSGTYPPIILLMSDGEPNDNWQKPLADLKQNGWFKRAIKIAFAIADEASNDVLAEFVGSREAIIHVNDMTSLEKFIVKASEITSEFQSRSKSSEEVERTSEASSEDLVTRIMTEVSNDTMMMNGFSGDFNMQNGSSAAGGFDPWAQTDPSWDEFN
ncbi:MAG: VWA domain-containing protein [Oscillospiraceae bacterium]|nr:VWA domain-containing protein [Oscillospiraceae bacterium]